MDWSWLFDILRSILFWLDTVIYGFIGDVYELLYEIASVTIFSNDTITAISNKVYALLGIFMLFKVSFSILSYVVTPDDFYDKNKGFGKIITDIVVTLAILVVMPWIFNKAMEIQGVILRDNIIGNILLTDETSQKQSILSTGKTAAGREMAFTTFTAFFKINPDECATGDDKTNKLNTDDYFKEAIECLGPDTQYGRVYDSASKGRDIRTFANNAGIVNLKSEDNKDYMFEYNYIISTLSGGFILLILILFCFDVGVRTIKLGFLRMIAPIPIISRIDPKKGKEVFDKFVKTCINTYLDLFIRLLSINLAVFVISILQVGIYDATDSATDASISFLGMVFIILGALLFAKQFPQLLQDIFGIKLDGSFTLNPMKKLGSVPLAGNLAARTLGAAGSLAIGQGFRSGWKAGGKAVSWKGDGKSVTGGLSRFTDEGRKSFEARKLHDYGEKLYQNNKDNPYGIYKGINAQKYGDSAKLVDNAKSRRDAMQSEYESKRLAFESRRSDMSESELNIAMKDVENSRIAALKAASDYDKVKKSHDYLRSQDARNAQIEDAFNAAKDANESRLKVEKYINSEPSNSTTTNTSSTGGYSTTGSTESSAQQYFNELNNVHDAPTKDEHNARYQDLFDTFGGTFEDK